MLWSAVLWGCGTLSASVTTDTGDTVDTETVSTPTEPTDLTPAELDYPGGLRIAKISAYQGVESILALDGEPPRQSQVPLVAGRELLLRVFLEPDRDFDPREVAVILTVTNGRKEEVIDRTPFVRSASTDAVYDSTVNFVLSEDLIDLGTELSVELHEVDGDAPGGGDRRDAVWKGRDLDIDETGTVVVAIQPIRYRYDGSNRLPDTSEDQMQRIEDQMMAMYPAKRVRLRVDRALDYDRRISPLSSSEWSRILQEIAVMRSRADEEPNTYYYGLFNPEPTEFDYCRQGCILGLSLLASGTNDPYFRSSVGLGYSTPTTGDTLVHEVGHAHGRSHAPCGLGGQSSDRLYPYAGASIGTWGWDLRDGRLLDPNRTVDMMSYCAPIWVSDYTWAALYDQIRGVERSPRAATVTRQMYAFDPASDSLEPLGDATLAATSVGEPVRVRITSPTGRRRTVTGSLYRFGDEDGGFVALDEALAPGAVAVVVD
jgi:hypothetical protein